MNKARLIKRKELIEQEQAAQKHARPSFAVRAKVETVADWVKRYRAHRQPNAHAVFAELFAHQQQAKSK